MRSQPKLTFLRLLLKTSLFCCLSMSAVCFASALKEIQESPHIAIPSLDIHGNIAMAYYNIGRPMEHGPTRDTKLGAGYFFRPYLEFSSSVNIGAINFQAVSGLSITPFDMDLIEGYIKDAGVTYGPRSKKYSLSNSYLNVLYETWTLSAEHLNFGRLELGKSPTESFKATFVSFSPFQHRSRGGYEDFLSAPVEMGTAFDDTEGQWVDIQDYLVAYFSETAGLLDAPHLSYTSPSFSGFRFVGEYVSAPYSTYIGFVQKNASAFTGLYRGEAQDISYDARISYAHNVMNAYSGYFGPGHVLAGAPGWDISQIIFGDQINLSAAVAYKDIDASFSYGYEMQNKAPVREEGEFLNCAAIKPSISEVTLGYAPLHLLGGKMGVRGSYALAKDYAKYSSIAIASSKAILWGLALGHFIGDLSTELHYQHLLLWKTILKGLKIYS